MEELRHNSDVPGARENSSPEAEQHPGQAEHHIRARRPLVLGIWLAPLAWMAVIFFLSAQPNPSVFSPVHIEGEESLGHLLLYVVLGVLLWRAARGTGVERLAKRPGIWTLLVGWIYAISDEMHQAFVPKRFAELIDLVTDCVGLGLGIAIAALALAFSRARESRRSPDWK